MLLLLGLYRWQVLMLQLMRIRWRSLLSMKMHPNIVVPMSG
jgi:hypothetical protein